MRQRTHRTLMVLALGLGLSTAAAAQQRPTIAFMPTQYFSANEQSAENVTQSLVQQFGSRGYRVVPMERARQTFQEMGFSLTRDIGDREILQFGRRIGADLVGHPQLLAMGIPMAGDIAASGGFTPHAVLYLRVLNTQTGKALYTRQVGQEIPEKRPLGSGFTLSESTATAVADKVSRGYFERVAGSRQEYDRRAPRER